jgi:hypothetical protein
MRSFHRAVAVSLAALVASGCYTSRVTTKAPLGGGEVRKHQWYALAGLVPLSNTGGIECQNGLARVEDSFTLIDIAISVGLSLGGALVGLAACPYTGDAGLLGCTGAGAALMPLLLGSRSLSYVCEAPPSAGAVIAPQGDYPPLPPPAPGAPGTTGPGPAYPPLPPQ